MSGGGELIREAREWKAQFEKAAGGKVRKFSGAVTIELLRAALAHEGIVTSARDVFIIGVPLEIDLVIPSPGVEAPLGLIYKPEQVALALEVKNGGAYPGAYQKIRHDFDLLRAAGYDAATSPLRRGATTKRRQTRSGSRPSASRWHGIHNLQAPSSQPAIGYGSSYSSGSLSTA